MNRCRSDYCSDYGIQSAKKARLYAVYETVAGDSGCVLGFSCCARKAQASRFGTKTQLAGKTLTPMPPAGGGLTVELWHKSETHIGAAVCSAAWGALCRRVRFCGPPAHPCRSAPHKRHICPPCGAKKRGLASSQRSPYKSNEGDDP